MLLLRKHIEIYKTPQDMYGVYDLVREYLGLYSLTGSELFIGVQRPYDAGGYDYDDSHLPYWRQHPGYYHVDGSPYTYVRKINYPYHTRLDDNITGEIHIYRSSVQWWIECAMDGPFFRSYLAADESDDIWIFVEAIARLCYHAMEDDCRLPTEPRCSSIKFVTIDDHMVDGSDVTPTIRFWELCSGDHTDKQH